MSSPRIPPKLDSGRLVCGDLWPVIQFSSVNGDLRLCPFFIDTMLN